MFTRILRWVVWAAFAAWLATLTMALLSGCAWYEEMVNRPPQPDTRIHLQLGQHMEFARITRKNPQGQSIEEYTCEPLLMYCTDSGVELSCRCEIQ